MYPLTFFVKTLAPNVGGEARGLVIRILEKYRHDEGLYQHELLHVKQWFVWSLLSLPVAYVLYKAGHMDFIGLAVLPLVFHTALYRFVPAYRLWAESEAYKEQAKYYPDDRRPLFAEYLAEYYNLKITKEEALKLLNRS